MVLVLQLLMLYLTWTEVTIERDGGILSNELLKKEKLLKNLKE